MDEARSRMVAGIVLEKRATKIYSLKRRAEGLYHSHVIGVIDEAQYQAEGAAIRSEAASLGVRLVRYNSGLNCISLMTVEASR